MQLVGPYRHTPRVPVVICSSRRIGCVTRRRGAGNCRCRCRGRSRRRLRPRRRAGPTMPGPRPPARPAAVYPGRRRGGAALGGGPIRPLVAGQPSRLKALLAERSTAPAPPVPGSEPAADTGPGEASSDQPAGAGPSGDDHDREPLPPPRQLPRRRRLGWWAELPPKGRWSAALLALLLLGAIPGAWLTWRPELPVTVAPEASPPGPKPVGPPPPQRPYTPTTGPGRRASRCSPRRPGPNAPGPCCWRWGWGGAAGRDRTGLPVAPPRPAAAGPTPPRRRGPPPARARPRLQRAAATPGPEPGAVGRGALSG